MPRGWGERFPWESETKVPGTFVSLSRFTIVAVAVAVLLVAVFFAATDRDAPVCSRDTDAEVVQVPLADERAPRSDVTIAASARIEIPVDVAIASVPVEAPATRLQVRVVALPDDVPLPGIRCWLDDSGDEATSDSEGIAAFDSVAPGTTSLRVGDRPPIPVSIEPGQTHEVTVRVDFVTAVRGHVFDDRGALVPGAAIHVVANLQRPDPTAVHCAGRADSEGAFHVSVPVSASIWAATDDGRKSTPMRPLQDRSAIAGSTSTVRLVVSPAELRVRGRVVDRAWNPLAGAAVDWFEPRHDVAATVTDTSGTFVLGIDRPNPTSREVRVRASLRGYGESTLQIALDGIGASDLLFVLAEAVTVHGRVIDPTGGPIADVDIAFWHRRATVPSMRARSRADGTFTLNDVPNDANGTITARHEAHEYASMPLTLTPTAASTDVGALILVPVPILLGTLRRADGTPLADWVVTSRTTGGAPGRRAVADADGRFTLALPPGDAVRLNAWMAGRRLRFDLTPDRPLRAADAGRREFVVTDAEWPDARLCGRIVERSGSPWRAGHVQLLDGTRSVGTAMRLDDDGTFDLGPFARGNYRLVWIANPLARTAPRDLVSVRLASGKTTDLGTLVVDSDGLSSGK